MIQAKVLASAKSKLVEDGWCVLEDVLTPPENAKALERLWSAVPEYARRPSADRLLHSGVDPNASNVRAYELLDIDPLFRELVRRPEALDLVESLLGPDFIISNFSANIARPGAKSMSLHSDQAFVVPEPWTEPWSINIIWCLTDVRFENGATLFIPGSHRVTRLDELGERPAERLVPFEARAGSIIAMDGRIWHTSGANVTKDEDRALLFGYYSRAFLRPQWNWNQVLSPTVQEGLDPEFRRLLGLETVGNVALAFNILSRDLGGLRKAD